MFDSLGALPPVGLEEVDRLAARLTRVDRKYVVTAELADDLVVSLPAGTWSALEIDGSRLFGYESHYYDTPDLRFFHQAATRRRRRAKVRVRRYLDSGEQHLELKQRTGRGETTKIREPHVGPAERLGAAAITALGRHLDRQVVPSLKRTLVTGYRRATAVDIDAGVRVTLDADVVCRNPAGSVGVGGIVVETKTAGPPCLVDRWLWRAGVRPLRLSKYCTAMAALQPDLPSNKWHRTLQRHIHVLDPS